MVLGTDRLEIRNSGKLAIIGGIEFDLTDETTVKPWNYIEAWDAVGRRRLWYSRFQNYMELAYEQNCTIRDGYLKSWHREHPDAPIKTNNPPAAWYAQAQRAFWRERVIVYKSWKQDRFLEERADLALRRRVEVQDRDWREVEEIRSKISPVLAQIVTMFVLGRTTRQESTVIDGQPGIREIITIAPKLNLQGLMSAMKQASDLQYRSVADAGPVPLPAGQGPAAGEVQEEDLTWAEYVRLVMTEGMAGGAQGELEALRAEVVSLQAQLAAVGVEPTKLITAGEWKEEPAQGVKGDDFVLWGR